MVGQRNQTVYLVLSAVILLSGCSVRRLSATDESSTGTPTPPPTPGVVITSFAHDQLKSCFTAPANATGIANCMLGKSAVPAAVLTAFQTAAQTCITANEAGSATFLAVCLETKNFISRGRRNPFQSDFAACGTAAGNTGIAGCLEKRGLLPAVMSQAQIDTCIAANNNTVTNLERCLRTAGAIPKKVVLSQFDVTMCSRVSGTPGLYACLLENQLIPLNGVTPTIVQADVDGCVATNMVAGVIPCLRTALKLRRNLVQAHIDSCVDVAGTAGTAACLTANGFALASNGTNLVQADIDGCVSVAGAGGIATCLRARGFLNKVLSQADIADCSQFAGPTGTDIQRCLTQNNLLPAGVAAAQIDMCITAVAADATLTVTKCLRNQNFIPKALMQADVNLCNRLVGGAGIANCLNLNFKMDAAITQTQVNTCLNDANIGLAKTASCLKNQGLVPTVLLQPHVASCLANAGLANVAACLNANGFVDPAPVAPLVLINQAMIDVCNLNVGPNNISACIAESDGVTRTLSQAHISSCNTFAGPTNIVTCLLTNSIDVPPGVDQTAINTCITNVGVANVYMCLMTAGLVP